MNANNKQTTITKIVAFDSPELGNTTQHQWKGIFWSIALIILMSLSLLACKGPQDQPPVQSADTAGLAEFQAQKLADSLAALDPANQDQFQEQGGLGNQYDESEASSNSANNASFDEDGSNKSENDMAGNTVDDGSGGAIDESTGNEVANNEVTETEAPVQKKKKFSNAGKGALIGAGSGAVLGAVISKRNRGLGAVIGAAVGGGAGYGIGRHKDKKQAQESE